MSRGRGGIQFEDLAAGTGPAATRDSTVEILYTLSLTHGDVVQRDVRCTVHLSRREAIAGLRYGVEGMQVGGRRLIRVSPHLGYADAGVPGSIPPGAVLVFDVQFLAFHETKEP
jgi:FKBP-type peptidyl-prolyl cis-trans isomerase